MSSTLIGAAEAAVILKCDRATVTRLATRGDLRVESQLPGLRQPRLFRRADVERLARKRATVTDTAVAS